MPISAVMEEPARAVITMARAYIIDLLDNLRNLFGPKDHQKSPDEKNRRSPEIIYNAERFLTYKIEEHDPKSFLLYILQLRFFISGFTNFPLSERCINPDYSQNLWTIAGDRVLERFLLSIVKYIMIIKRQKPSEAPKASPKAFGGMSGNTLSPAHLQRKFMNYLG